MKVKQILKLFKNNLEDFLNKHGEEMLDDDCFYVMICADGSYYQVDINESYWYIEDDGTVVFRVNDI